MTQVLITCVTEDTKDYTITVQDVEGGNDETYNSVEGFIVAFETPMYEGKWEDTRYKQLTW